MDILTRDFYSRDTLAVARDLLGRDIVRVLEDGTALRCRITETEAYIGRADKACHAYGYKRTSRTETLFAPPGTAYIYLIYGMYHCLNFVTEAEGEPAAAGNDKILPQRESLGHPGLQGTEIGLSHGLKDLRDGHALLPLNKSVGIHHSPLQPGGEESPHRSFSAAHHTDQHNIFHPSYPLKFPKTRISAESWLNS